jgi:AraC-like DNA-binding protein
MATREQELLFSKIEGLTRRDLNPEIAIPGLRVYRMVEPTGPTRYTHQPSVCLIAQGVKEILLGGDALCYDQNHFLVTSIDLPIVAQVPQASVDQPYLGLAYRLDQKDIAQVLAEGHLPAPLGGPSHRAMTVGTVTEPLLSAFVRLLDLVDEPEAIPFLAPAIGREILYRLLTSEAGSHLRQVGLRGSQNAQILRAVDWLKAHFADPLLVEDLADYCQMSLSAFHLHFRRVTAMTPIQYQKWLRLQEARRLMVTSDIDVTRAAYKVGYESSSQFSREYGRLFGVAPSKDLRSLRLDPAHRHRTDGSLAGEPAGSLGKRMEQFAG